LEWHDGVGLKVQSIPEAANFPSCTVPAELYEADTSRAAVLLVPAIGTPASYYRPFAKACADHGYHVLLPELPGNGASLPRPSWRFDYGYRELVDDYLPGLVEEMRSRCGDVPLILIGHSLGAHAGMLATLQNRISVEALVTVAGGHIHYRNWVGKGSGRVRMFAWLVAGLSYAFGRVPGRYLGLGGPQARTLMREWSRIIRSGSFSHIARQLERTAAIPALSIGYEGDFMAPSKSVASLAHMLGGDMEWVPVDWPGNPHSSWARYPARTLEIVDDWLVAHNVVPAA
jgi:predicted alpha/beta hydrolase